MCSGKSIYWHRGHKGVTVFTVRQGLQFTVLEGLYFLLHWKVYISAWSKSVCVSTYRRNPNPNPILVPNPEARGLVSLLTESDVYLNQTQTYT